MNGVPAIRPQFPDYGNVLARGAAIKGQEARNVLTQMQIEGYPEERNWLREQRGMLRQKMVWAEEDRTANRKKRLKDYEEQAKRMTKLDLENDRAISLEINNLFSRVTDVQDYIPFRNYMTTKGGYKNPVDPRMFRNPSAFMNPDGTPNEEAFDKYRDSFIMEGKDRVALNLAEAKKKEVKPTYDHQTIYGPEGQTKRVAIKKGEAYIPPDGWTLEKPSKEKEPSAYTVQQQIDDARQFYSLKMRSLLDPMGTGVLEGKEQEYDDLIDNLSKDLIAIKNGKEPSYLKEGPEQRLPGETIADYLKRTK